MRQFVDEGLEYEAKGVAARSAQRIHGNARRYQRRVKLKVRHESGRKLIWPDARLPGLVLFVLAKTDEMIPPCGQVARSVDRALQVVKAGRAIMIVANIIFPRPNKFYR